MQATQTLQPRRSPIPGFGLLVALLVLAAVGKAVLSDTLDPDCFWHLRVGQELARIGWPRPMVDDLSFASMAKPWTPYSWLAEIAMKKLWDAGGYRAAVAVQAAMQGAFVLLLALSGLETSQAATGRRRYLASALGAAGGGVLSLAYLSFRPVTAALVLLALSGYLLLRDRRMNQRSKAIWLVPALAAVLTNIHFFSLLIPLWTGALVVGDVLEKSQRRVGRGVILTALSLLGCEP